jgi:hypothetical protein
MIYLIVIYIFIIVIFCEISKLREVSDRAVILWTYFEV